MNLCGHATLATAHVIYAHKLSTVDRLEFLTRSGSLFVEKRDEKQYAMHFPAYEVFSAEKFSAWLSNGAVPQYAHKIAKVCALRIFPSLFSNSQAVAGELRIESLHIAPAARKLLVVIDSDASEYTFECSSTTT